MYMYNTLNLIHSNRNELESRSKNRKFHRLHPPRKQASNQFNLFTRRLFSPLLSSLLLLYML